jgi:hypothetical protein
MPRGWFQVAERSASKLAENVAVAALAPVVAMSRPSQQAASTPSGVRVRLIIIDA